MAIFSLAFRRCKQTSNPTDATIPPGNQNPEARPEFPQPSRPTTPAVVHPVTRDAALAAAPRHSHRNKPRPRIGALKGGARVISPLPIRETVTRNRPSIELLSPRWHPAPFLFDPSSAGFPPNGVTVKRPDKALSDAGGRRPSSGVDRPVTPRLLRQTDDGLEFPPPISVERKYLSPSRDRVGNRARPL